MSDNLFKSRWTVAENCNNKRMIDSNELVKKRMEEEKKRIEKKITQENIDSQNGFEEGLKAKQVDTLFDDMECETNNQEETVFFPKEIVYTGPSPEELIEEAKQEIEKLKTQADINIRQLEKKVKEQAKTTGYAEGNQRAENEYIKKMEQLHEKEKQLEKEYEENLQKMEVELVENLTDVYSHVLGVSLKDYSPVVLHVLDVAMHESDDVKNFMIHVSKDEVNMVKDNLEFLKKGLSVQTKIEIIEDITMKPGEAYIETDGEIFDCSIDTQLSNLSKEIRALTYRKKRNRQRGVSRDGDE